MDYAEGENDDYNQSGYDDDDVNSNSEQSYDLDSDGASNKSENPQ